MAQYYTAITHHHNNNIVNMKVRDYFINHHTSDLTSHISDLNVVLLC